MRKLTITLTFVVFLIASVCAHAAGVQWNWVQPSKVYEMMKEGSGLWLVDIRGERPYENVHVEGSMNISSLDLKYKNYPKQKLFVIIDASPGQVQARNTAAILIEKGYSNVYVLSGGLPAWELAGLPVVRTGSLEPFAVTPRELERALEDSAAVRVYDVRDAGAYASSRIEGSIPVGGTTEAEKLEELRKLIAGSGSLSERLKGADTVVLVSSASGNAREMARTMYTELKKDVRYLSGGYEAYVAHKYGRTGETKTVGQCPTCPVAE